VAAAVRFFGDRLIFAADAGFALLVRFFRAPIAAPVTAPSTVPTIGTPKAVPATAPATAPPKVLFVVPETAFLSPSSLSLSSISISVLLELFEKPGRRAEVPNCPYPQRPQDEPPGAVSFDSLSTNARTTHAPLPTRGQLSKFPAAVKSWTLAVSLFGHKRRGEETYRWRPSRCSGREVDRLSRVAGSGSWFLVSDANVRARLLFQSN
jgi:hypothetical protein